MDANLLEQKIDHLPTTPGVYLFKDERGTILYVGKAGSIKHRVSSYFQKPNGKDTKTLVLVGRVADIDTIVTDTEKEAFILTVKEGEIVQIKWRLCNKLSPR